ncbi:Stk1 family PASTA domain-containing Ser/Thr kinase [Cumulibacter soli]|uniref:Stk1 family PASTA domain-containing Ser/Thr kinase n=1 Tax=Cumulibacter soli TaxID=2546344 RepID=UPI001067CB91|nr:Stk1 family PASTA domain-containing Ser/Thr kinase [Cumulibacter soli]
MSASILGDRYEVGRLLGYGGMAEVHLARDTRLGRDVAVKILRSDLARDHTFQVRFRREGQSAASLNHASIVSVFDTGTDPTTDPPTPYIVMEYVEGQTLRDLLRQEEVLEPPQAMRIVAEMCGALDFSHRNGIVHRDVKPGNVMITPAGRVKVMDFGIARAVSDTAATMTATAAVVGTAQYLSPEQARGERNVDARSDVYAAGCVLYELLTGSPPFTGDSPVAVAYQHVREIPRVPSANNSAVPPALDAITMKALSKNPANRYQSAAEMQDDLDRAIMGEPVHAAPVLSEEEATKAIPGMMEPPSPDSAPVDETDEQKSGVSKRTWALLAALVAVILVAAFLLVPKLLGGDEKEAVPDVPVPSLSGMTLEEATTALEEKDLAVGDVEETPSSVEQKGKVLSQNPGADDPVAPGTAIDLSVGAGPVQVSVPDVVGKSQEEATQLLEAEGLSVNPIEQDGKQPAGTVVSTSPEAGASAPESSTVTIFVSNGMVEVPAVVGMAQADAEKALKDAGLQVSAQTQDSKEAAGTVIAADQESGTKVDQSTTVTITVSTGNVEVPDVRGMSQDEAVAALNEAGFENVAANPASEADSKDHDPGTVVDQAPVGEAASVDTQIELTIAQEVTETSSPPPSNSESPSSPSGSESPSSPSED